MKTYIGIDNGITRSISSISDSGVTFQKTPVLSTLDYTKKKKNITRVNFAKMVELLKSFSNNGDCLVILERPLVNPSRFLATSSALRCHEATLIAIEYLSLPYMFIDSKEWQKVLLPAGVSGAEDLKRASLMIGNRKFPMFSEVKHPDRDSLLIAEYCRVNRF